MAKEKIPSTPETRAKKLEDKMEVRKAFRKTFFPALAICLSILLIYSICYISFFKPKESTIEGSPSQNSAINTNTNTNSNTNTNTNSNTPSDNGSSNSNSGTPSDNSNSAAPADNGGNSSAPAANDTASVLEEFNTAINRVKSEGTITHVSGGSKNNGGVDPDSKLPGLIKGAANGIINAAMSSNGVKDDGSVIDASKFPVENTSYSSQLTVDDVVSATKNGNTITIVVRDDELGEADTGHGQKALNVIKAATIMENIPQIASSIASEAKTSAKNGTIVVTIDDSGRVTKADYTFDWDIEIIGSVLDAIIHLASEEHYSIAY